MAIRTYKINLDSKNTIAPEPIFLRQGDKTGAVIIDARVTDKGSAFNLDGLTPVFKANTADNKAVIIDSTGFSIVDASNGEFTYKVPGALSTAPGKIRTAYFGFTDPSGVESTFNLTFVVQAAPDVGTVKSENYITVINGTYANISELTAAYPQGNPGIFVTTDDQNWDYWDDKKGAWIAGGPFNAHPLTDEDKKTVRKYVLDNENLIKNGYFVDGDISALQTNSAVGKKWIYLDGIDWANVSGNHTNGDGKADAYFSLTTDDQRLLNLAYESFNFGFDILAQSAARFDVFMDVVTTSKTYRTVLEHNLTLELGMHHHVNVVAPTVNEVKAHGSDALKVNIGLSPLDDSVDYNIGLCKITRFSLPTNLTDDQPLAYKVNKMHNLFPDQSLLTHKASEFQCTNGNFSYDEINGERFAKFSYNGSSGWYDAFSSIDIGKNPEVLQDLLNHQHRYEFNGYVKSDTDVKLSVDVFTNDGKVQRVTFGYLHLTAEEMNNLSFIIPKLNTFGLVNLSKVTIVNFVISNVSATDMWINDVRIDTRQARKEAQGKNYLPDSLEEILEQGYLKHGDGIAIGRNHFDGLDWLTFYQNQSNVKGNRDITISFANPARVDKVNTINWQQLLLKYIVNTTKRSAVTMRIDVINNDPTKNVTIPLATKQVLASIDTNVECLTPIISNVASIDMSTVSSINYVINCDYPDKDFVLMIADLSLMNIPNDANDPDAIFTDNAFNRYGGKGLFLPSDASKDFEYHNNRPALHIHSEKAGINSAIAFNLIATSIPNAFDSQTELKLTIDPDKNANFIVTCDLFGASGYIGSTDISKFAIGKSDPQSIRVTIPALSKLSNGKATSANIAIKNDMPTDSMSYHITDFSFRRSLTDNSQQQTEAFNANALPVMKLYGDVPASATDKKTNRFTYQDGSYVVNGYTKTSWQGQSSQSLPKKSYKFKPYSDAKATTKLKMQTDPKFAPASDFVLKAYYNDPTLSLDNIGNEIMHDLAASRKTFSADLNSTAYLGQCYGKPVELYFNDNYQGLYFFRSGAKENTYGVDGKDATKFVIEGESEKGAAMFQAPSVTKWGDGTGDGLDVEFEPNVPDALTDDQKAKFNAFVKMVNDGDIEKFKANTLQTSVEAAIDYIIFYNLMGSVDSCGRNLEWVTWDNGAHFTVIPYDFDQMFFNDYNGLGRADKNVNAFPVVQMRFGTTHNKYFDLIAQAYPKQLNDRYYELRKNIMREDNIIKRFTDYGSDIGIANYSKDLAKWPIAGRLVSYQYLQAIVYDRFKIVDTQFAAFIASLLS